MTSALSSSKSSTINRFTSKTNDLRLKGTYRRITFIEGEYRFLGTEYLNKKTVENVDSKKKDLRLYNARLVGSREMITAFLDQERNKIGEHFYVMAMFDLNQALTSENAKSSQSIKVFDLNGSGTSEFLSHCDISYSSIVSVENKLREEYESKKKEISKKNHLNIDDLNMAIKYLSNKNSYVTTFNRVKPTKSLLTGVEQTRPNKHSLEAKLHNASNTGTWLDVTKCGPDGSGIRVDDKVEKRVSNPYMFTGISQLSQCYFQAKIDRRSKSPTKDSQYVGPCNFLNLIISRMNIKVLPNGEAAIPGNIPRFIEEIVARQRFERDAKTGMRLVH